MEEERLAMLCDKAIINNKKYQDLNRKILNLEHKLKLKLDENGISIFIEYEEVIMEQLALSKVIMYNSIQNIST